MAGSEKRQIERRVRTTPLYSPERRSGFDRRRPSPVLGLLRDSRWVLLTVLVALNMLSLADWLLTMTGLSAGAAEGNPVLAGLMGHSLWVAGGFKFAVVLGVSVLVWQWRHFRAVLATLMLGVALYLAVIAYHFTGLLATGAI